MLNPKGMTMLRDTIGRRVLLVEDEAMIAMLIEDMLEDLGHSLAAVATRLEEALALARSEALDLAILDLSLGGTLTYPVADVLRERRVPFIFATGYGSDGKSPLTKRPWAAQSQPRSPRSPESLWSHGGMELPAHSVIDGFTR
jgi:CheY-like chemotaxis protein